MSQTLTVGPLALPLPLLVALAALALGWFVAGRIARRRGLDVEPQLYIVLAAGLLAARAGFVLRHSAAYLDAPLGILDMRDGGWSPFVGLAAAAATALLLAAWRRASAAPLAAGLAIAAFGWLGGTAALDALGERGTRLPPLALAALDGAAVPLDRFQGRPVVVNLWATWCPPCRREMPVLLQAQRQRADVHFVFVNQGEAADKVANYLAQQQLPLGNVLLDASGQAAAALGARGLPTTLFFDAGGRLVASRVGELSAATLAERLDAVAPRTPPQP